ncbi:MAG: sulfurtransferase complex subunit TusC [Pseudomonadales bacterium]
MKRILFVQSRAPYGTLSGQEGLDALLMGSAFVECALLFLGDGIYQLLSNQDAAALGLKDYSVSFGALKDYGVQNLYCSESDLQHRVLETDDLVIPVTALDDAAIRELMASHDVILSF